MSSGLCPLSSIRVASAGVAACSAPKEAPKMYRRVHKSTAPSSPLVLPSALPSSGKGLADRTFRSAAIVVSSDDESDRKEEKKSSPASGKKRTITKAAPKNSVEGEKKAKQEKQEPIPAIRYWLNVVSLEHVKTGVEGGFTQACHGKKSALERMKKGDGIVHYSPKVMMGEGAACKKFTSIGRIADDRIYKFDMGGGFVPHRRDVVYEKNVTLAPIAPLLPVLSFSKDKGKNWGMVLRAGLISITEEDFKIISARMIRSVTSSGIPAKK